jgi:hypothetical protein
VPVCFAWPFLMSAFCSALGFVRYAMRAGSTGAVAAMPASGSCGSGWA